METRETSNSTSTNDLTEAKRRGFSRRSVLALAGAIGAAAPFGVFRAARALTTAPYLPADSPICRAAATGEVRQGPPRKLTLAWMASAICTSAAPVAKERGIFAKHNLDVDFVNFGGITEQLLEAIPVGKADAGIGMALRCYGRCSRTSSRLRQGAAAAAGLHHVDHGTCARC
jgi:NitT/TauT family transport system substrate-binding protein